LPGNSVQIIGYSSMAPAFNLAAGGAGGYGL